ncbi:MAG: transcriptional regulator [Herbaspirillum sp.]|jgi:hypothetical protein|nr:transcriptional regulator [Herbaspirillum sp.]
MQKSCRTVLKTITGIAVVSICASASAADWRSIGSTNAGELLIDAASLEQHGDIRQAWSMWNFKEARKNNEAGFPTLKSYKDLQLYNCKDKTMRLSKEIIFAEANGMGDSRDHSDALANSAFAKPAEHTVAAAMLEQVCAADMTKP